MRNITLLLFIILISCNKKNENKTQENLSIKNKWDCIRVYVDNNRFLISSNEDSLYYTNYDKRKVTYDSTSRMYDDKNESIQYFLSKADRDSLLNYCYQAIVNPTIEEGKVSDYAGQYVLIQIENGQTQISCQYSSIAENWQTMSPTLKKIDQLTFGKIKQK